MSSDTGKHAPNEAFEGAGVSGHLDDILSITGGAEPDFNTVMEAAAEVKDREPSDAEPDVKGKKVVAFVGGQKDVEKEKPRKKSEDTAEEDVEESDDSGEGSEAEEEAEETGETPEEAGDEELTLAQQNEQLKTQIQNMMSLVEELSSRGSTPPPATAVPTPETDKAAPARTQADPEALSTIPSLTEEDFNDPEAMSLYIKSVAIAAAQTARQQALVGVDSIVASQLNTRAAISAFFQRPENSDLNGLSATVLQKAQEIQRAQPELGPAQLLEAASADLRKRGVTGMIATENPVQETRQVPAGAAQRRFAQATASRGPVLDKKKGKRKQTKDDVIADQIEDLANLEFGRFM